MARALVLCALVAALCTTAVLGADKCKWSDYSYPPGAEADIPQYIFNLDLPPEQRWAEIATQYADGIQDLVGQVLKMLGEKLSHVVENLMALDEQRIFGLIGEEYAQEISGMSAAAGMNITEGLIMNMAYEIGGVGCTSIVAQGANGDVYHARNLDFGLFDGYSFKNDTWDLTTRLRNILIQLQVQKGGVTLYNTTTFAGFVGLLTGAKANGFSISVDSRYDDNLDKYFIEWLEGKYVAQELTMFLRSVMTNNQTFADAVTAAQNVRLAGPAYIIIGGINPGEGAVISRAAESTVDTYTLPDAAAGGQFYVVETNYDRWKEPPFFDNRRTPARRCLNETGSDAIGVPTLFNVLSAQPMRNQLTTQTVLMQPATGRYESYKQWCRAPCEPW